MAERVHLIPTDPQTWTISISAPFGCDEEVRRWRRFLLSVMREQEEALRRRSEFKVIDGDRE
jgi:hypothetical protein